MALTVNQGFATFLGRQIPTDTEQAASWAVVKEAGTDA